MIIKSRTLKTAAGEVISRHEFSQSVPVGPPLVGVPPPPPLEPPSLIDLAKNFAGAVARWAESGFALVDELEYRTRLSLCRSCSHWEENARAGLGKCNHPKCGCTKGKLWLRSERCPLGLWR